MAHTKHARRHSCRWLVLETRQVGWNWALKRPDRREQVLRCEACGKTTRKRLPK